MNCTHHARSNPPPSDGMILLIVVVVLVLFTCWARSAPTENEVRKAKAVCRASHPVCEACGKAPLLWRMEAHHIKPVHAFPDLAADTNNLIALCRTDHIQFGHAGDGACRKYVENLREVLALRIIKENKP